jgi:hypothetical protein
MKCYQALTKKQGQLEIDLPEGRGRNQEKHPLTIRARIGKEDR